MITEKIVPWSFVADIFFIIFAAFFVYYAANKPKNLYFLCFAILFAEAGLLFIGQEMHNNPALGAISFLCVALLTVFGFYLAITSKNKKAAKNNDTNI